MYITLHIIWKLHGTITTKMGIIDMKINIIIGWGFCDIWNSQGRGKCYQPWMITLSEAWLFRISLKANLIIVLLHLLHCFEENNDKHTVARNLNWYCHRKSCIACTTNSLFSCLLADKQLICRLRWFPKLAVGLSLSQWEDRYWVQCITILIKIIYNSPIVLCCWELLTLFQA